jgi:hypothetical protein
VRLRAGADARCEQGGWEAASRQLEPPTVPETRRRSAAVLALSTLVALALSAGSAQAGPLVASAGECAEESLSKPFLPWLDPADYVLAPDGGFESGASGWRMGEASVVAAGNEPWSVRAAGDSASLAVPAGKSVTSPAMCVGVEHPTLRLFAKRTSGLATDALKVEVLFEDAAGTVHSAAIGAVASDGSWSPTQPMAIAVNLLPLLPGERTAVAFRFTAAGTGGWRIDDVYVDPYCRC